MIHVLIACLTLSFVLYRASMWNRSVRACAKTLECHRSTDPCACDWWVGACRNVSPPSSRMVDLAIDVIDASLSHCKYPYVRPTSRMNFFTSVVA